MKIRAIDSKKSMLIDDGVYELIFIDNLGNSKLQLKLLDFELIYSLGKK